MGYGNTGGHTSDGTQEVKDELRLQLVPSAEITGVMTWPWPQQVMEKGLGASQSTLKKKHFCEDSRIRTYQ